MLPVVYEVLRPYYAGENGGVEWKGVRKQGRMVMKRIHKVLPVEWMLYLFDSDRRSSTYNNSR